MKVPRTERDSFHSRTLDSLQADHEAYLADGSRRARAKDVSHSVIAKSILPVPVDHVNSFLISASQIDL